MAFLFVLLKIALIVLMYYFLFLIGKAKAYGANEWRAYHRLPTDGTISRYSVISIPHTR